MYHTLFEVNPFIFIETSFIAKIMVLLYIPYVLDKNVYFFVGWSIL